MTDTYSVHDAETRFSRLLARVAFGEEVIIAEAGEPIAKLVPVRRETQRIPGTVTGLWVADDFDAAWPSELGDASSQGRPAS